MLAALCLSACGDLARLPVSAGTGPAPTLPEPRSTLFPTVNIAPAQGWPVAGAPRGPAGTRVQRFAQDLDHPRWLLVLPNGDVLVAETNAPTRPDDAGGIRGWIMGLVMERAGAGTPSANRITLLRDTQGTGVADQRFVLLEGLHSPFGMAWERETGLLWTAVNERDKLGSDLVPDYLTAVHDGAFYGWPYSWYGNHVDTRVQPPRPNLVAQARVPDCALGPHTASLGLVWSDGTTLPGVTAQGMFVGQHGSWNRRPHSGYKVVFVPFVNGSPSGLPLDVLTGFLSDDGRALERPVGVALDGRGALPVADDVGNIIWRLSALR